MPVTIWKSAFVGVRGFRSAALNAGVSGTFVNLPWDAESATPAKLGFQHSNTVNPEEITSDVTGRILVIVSVKFQNNLLLSQSRAELQVNGTTVVDSSHQTAGPFSCHINHLMDIVAGDVLRVRFAAVGLLNAPLDVGETETFIEISE